MCLVIFSWWSFFSRYILGLWIFLAGFYCDQRESRDAVRKLSHERAVLDM